MLIQSFIKIYLSVLLKMFFLSYSYHFFLHWGLSEVEFAKVISRVILTDETINFPTTQGFSILMKLQYIQSQMQCNCFMVS